MVVANLLMLQLYAPVNPHTHTHIIRTYDTYIYIYMAYLIHVFKSVILILNSNFVRELISENFFYSIFFCKRAELESWVKPNGAIVTETYI